MTFRSAGWLAKTGVFFAAFGTISYVVDALRTGAWLVTPSGLGATTLAIGLVLVGVSLKRLLHEPKE